MLVFVSRRLAESIPVLVLASMVVFSMLHLVPGDPIDAMMGAAAFQATTRQDVVDRIREELGLNDPVPVQYARWAVNAIRGDLGHSFIRNRPVGELILERLPSTLELAGLSMVIAAALGLACGLLAALKRNTPIDGLVMAMSLGGVSMPGFWFALLLILVFSVLLGLLPATGSGTFAQLILPAVALGYEGV